MLFRRIYNDRLAQAAFLVACQRSKEAIIVDPLRDPAPYLAAAEQEGVRITRVAETHIHADFLSGAAVLAEVVGAELLLSAEGSGVAGYDHAAFPRAHWLCDGERIELGQIRLEVLHTPGHTPEHVAFLVSDLAASDAPLGLLSGDFLFVGDVGRPDLLERAAGLAGTMQSAAHDLYRSLRRLDTLPDYVQLWPGHGAGSACGKALGALPQSTLGYERLTNWALRPTSEADFVARVLEGQPEPPAYFARMKHLNAPGAPPLPPHARLDEGHLRARLQQQQRVLAVDLRPAAAFAAGHLAGAINVPLGKSFLTWAGSVIPTDWEVVLIAAPGAREAAEAAARELPLIGLDRVLGVLAPANVADLGLAVVTLASVPAAALGPAAADDRVVLDVRNRSEWNEGHVPGALHIPLAELVARVHELRAHVGRPIAVHCQGGSRSAVAASVLQAEGFADVSNVEGGYSAWARAGNRPATGP
jgi:hydroxyacylglutathione hydrolase